MPQPARQLPRELPDELPSRPPQPPQKRPSSLPPGVMDMRAPQYDLPGLNSATSPAIRTAIPISIPQAPRRLSPTDARLVRFLRSRLGFTFGAEAFVRKHGAHAILAALHDGVMIWQERRQGRPGPNGTRIIETWDERVPNPRLKSPAACLNKMLNNP